MSQGKFDYQNVERHSCLGISDTMKIISGISKLILSILLKFQLNTLRHMITTFYKRDAIKSH